MLPKSAELKDRILENLLGYPKTEQPTIKEIADNLESTGFKIEKQVDILAKTDYLVVHKTDGEELGIVILLEAEEVREFLSGGGYSKIEALKQVSNDEMMHVLKELQFEDAISIPYQDWDFKYSRKKIILNQMVALNLIKISPESSKLDKSFIIDKEGEKARNTGIINKNKTEIKMNNKFNGPTQFVAGDNNGDMNQDNSKKN